MLHCSVKIISVDQFRARTHPKLNWEAPLTTAPIPFRMDQDTTQPQTFIGPQSLFRGV
jgi:hypothetical protein